MNANASLGHSFTLKVKLGSTAVITQAFTMPVGVSNFTWTIATIITCRTTGGTGTVMGQRWILAGGRHLTGANTSTTTIDTTASQTIDVTMTWGAASASDTITGTNVFVEVFN